MTASRQDRKRGSRRRRKPARRGGSPAPPTRQAGGAVRELARLATATVGATGHGIVATSEGLGRLELRAVSAISTPLRGVGRRGRAALAAVERIVTPPRAVAAVILAAAISLGVSQFLDYRGVAIGAQLYEGVGDGAPVPQTDRLETGSAHSYVLLPVAALVIMALPFALRGRWQLGRAITGLGLIALGVALLVDIPKGLDEGVVARSFGGAEATLIEGFWVQLSSAIVLGVSGVLLGRYVRAGRPAHREAAAARRRSERRGAAPPAGASA